MKFLLLLIIFALSLLSCNKDYGSCSCETISARYDDSSGVLISYSTSTETIELEKDQTCEDLSYGNHGGSKSCEEIL